MLFTLAAAVLSEATTATDALAGGVFDMSSADTNRLVAFGVLGCNVRTALLYLQQAPKSVKLLQACHLLRPAHSPCELLSV